MKLNLFSVINYNLLLSPPPITLRERTNAENTSILKNCVEPAAMQHQPTVTLSTETPLIQLRHLTRALRPKVMAKLEYMNPAYSHHFRAAQAIVQAAEEQEQIHPGMTLVDWSLGSSAIALAMVAVNRGYKLLLAVPDTIASEQQNILRALGAELIITPADALPDEARSCMMVAQSLVKSIPHAFFVGMYDNPLSVKVHSDIMAPELLRQCNGSLTHLVVPLGSGALAFGISRALKAANPTLKVIGVEPKGSIYASLFQRGELTAAEPWEMEEIGARQPSPFWERSLLDDVVQISDHDAFNCARELLRTETLFVGGASGAAMVAALQLAEQGSENDTIAVILTDFGGYSFSRLYNDDWMRKKGFYRKVKSSLEQITAEDILQRKARRNLIFAHPEHTLAEVFEMMKQNDVSQMPIVSYNAPIGSISENRILSILIEQDDAMNAKVIGFMEKPFPVCSPDATISELSARLQQNASGVLVNLSDGKLQLLTKSDLIDALTHK